MASRHPALGGVAAKVAAQLAEHLDHTTGIVYRALDILADDVNASRRAVIDALATLVQHGFLAIHERGGGKAKATRYTLAWPQPVQAKQCTPVHRIDEPYGAKNSTHTVHPSAP